MGLSRGFGEQGNKAKKWKGTGEQRHENVREQGNMTHDVGNKGT